MNTAPFHGGRAAWLPVVLLGALIPLTGCRTVTLNDARDESPPQITVSIIGDDLDMRVAYGDLIPNINWSGTHRRLLRDGQGFRHGFIEPREEYTVVATATDPESGIARLSLRVAPQGYCRTRVPIAYTWNAGDTVHVIGGPPPPGPGDTVRISRTVSVKFCLRDIPRDECEFPLVTHLVFEAWASNHKRGETSFRTRTFP